MKTLKTGISIALILAAGIIVSGCTKKAPSAPAPTTSSHGNSDSTWLTDFEKAKQTAKNDGKDLLVNFSGSDWCYWCKKLDAEVFSKADFVTEAEKKFVLVTIDYPSDTSGQTEAIQKQNKRLADEYKVEGFPTVLLMDAEGTSFAQTGYQDGGSQQYLDHLDQLLKQKPSL